MPRANAWLLVRERFRAVWPRRTRAACGLALALAASPAPASAVSFQGGTVLFGQPVRVDDLGGAPIASILPSMIVDGQNRIFVVWEDARDASGNAQVYFSRSLDEGATFSANAQISNLPAYVCRFPRVFSDTRGHLHVVWQGKEAASANHHLFYTYSSNQGSTFSAPIRVSDNISGYNPLTALNAHNLGPQPQVIVDDASPKSAAAPIVYVGWTNYTGGSALYAHVAASTDLFATAVGSLQVNQVSNVCRHPALALDPGTGRIFVAWEQSLQGNTDNPNPGCALQGFDFSLASPGASCRIFPDFGTAPNAFKDVLVNDDGPNGAGGKWHPSLSLAGGNLALVWQDERTGGNTPAAFFARVPLPSAACAASCTPACPIVQPVPNVNASVGEGGADHLWPVVSQGPAGVLVMAWQQKVSGHYEIGMSASADGGATWSAGQTFPLTWTGTNPGSFDSNLYPPALKVVESGGTTSFFLVWQDFQASGNAGDVYFAKGIVSRPKADLSEFKAFPNPFRRALRHSQIVFANLTRAVDLRFFTPAGDELASERIRTTESGGQIAWTVPAWLAGGVYVARIEGTNDDGKRFVRKVKLGIVP